MSAPVRSSVIGHLFLITLKNTLIIHEQNSKEIHFQSMSVYYDTEFF